MAESLSSSRGYHHNKMYHSVMKSGSVGILFIKGGIPPVGIYWYLLDPLAVTLVLL